MWARLRAWAGTVKRDAVALYLCARDPRVPVPAKLLALAVAAYAFSPIDLIPDFIPILGYLDDLVILPLGIIAAIRLIPAEILAENRQKALALAERPVSRGAAAAVILVWLAAGASSAWAVSRYLTGT